MQPTEVDDSRSPLCMNVCMYAFMNSDISKELLTRRICLLFKCHAGIYAYTRADAHTFTHHTCIHRIIHTFIYTNNTAHTFIHQTCIHSHQPHTTHTKRHTHENTFAHTHTLCLYIYYVYKTWMHPNEVDCATPFLSSSVPLKCLWGVVGRSRCRL